MTGSTISKNKNSILEKRMKNLYITYTAYDSRIVKIVWNTLLGFAEIVHI